MALSYGMDPLQTYATPGEATRNVVRRQEEELTSRWRGKLIHGAYGKQICEPKLDRRATHAWLRDGRLQARTEVLLVAAQDGVVHTRAYQHRVLKMPGVSEGAAETIGHIISACPAYGFTLFKDRHDRVLYQVVKAVAKALP